MAEEMILSLVTAACVLALAVVSKWLLAQPLDLVVQFTPIWVFCAYLATHERKGKTKPGRRTLGWSALIIVLTAAVALVYAL